MLAFFKSLSTQEKISFLVKAAIVIMSVLALLNNPYMYYIVLRRAILIGSVYMIYQGITQKQYTWIGIAIVSAIVFNPFVTPRLEREIWSLLNVLAAVEFGLSAYKLK